MKKHGIKNKVFQHDTVIGKLYDRMGEDRNVTVAQCILLLASLDDHSGGSYYYEHKQDQEKAEELLREVGLLPILYQADDNEQIQM